MRREGVSVMASGIEIRTTQKAFLFDLLKAKQDADAEKALNSLITKMEAIMEEEDVAYVEKKVNSLD